MRTVRLMVRILVVVCIGLPAGCLMPGGQSRGEDGDSRVMLEDSVPEDEAGGIGPANVFSKSISPVLSSPAPAVEFPDPPKPTCLAVNPEKVNLGGRKFGEQAMAPLEISACNEVPLLIYGIYMAKGSSPDFDWACITGTTTATAPRTPR